MRATGTRLLLLAVLLVESTSRAQDVRAEAPTAETPSDEPSDGSVARKIVRTFRFLRHSAQRPSGRPPVAAVGRRQMYFPDWANTNGCKLDEGDSPLWMTMSGSVWMRDTLAECCEDYFGWNYRVCSSFYGNGPPIAQSAEDGGPSRRPPQHTGKAVPPRRLRGAEEEVPQHTSQGVPSRHSSRPRGKGGRQRLRGTDRMKGDERESRIGVDEHREEVYAYERKTSEAERPSDLNKALR